MQRVWVVGTSGSGKSTLAAALAARDGLPRLELDSVYHQADWQPLERTQFRARVAEFVAQDAWVVDGNYLSELADLVQARADTVVWLNMPKRVVMRQVIGRTIGRLVHRRVLWNGNRERVRNFFTLDPYESVIMWAWTRYDANVERYSALQLQLAEPGSPTSMVRLRSRAEVAAFLAEPAVRAPRT